MFKIFPINGGVCASEEFYAQGVSVGLRGNENPDVAFIYSSKPCEISALFTTNRFQAAPIKHFLAKGAFQTNFVLINAKNANAMTGEAGIEDINELLNQLNSKFTHILNPVMSSTGVIGIRLPKEKISTAFNKFDLNSKDFDSASRAIMTTDAFKKEIALKVVLEDGSSFHIGAMAKGAGMINPAMATMLCFVTTDAAAPKADIDELLKELVHTTFNAISVDGDTSTNDTIMVLANSSSGAYDKAAFKEALRTVMHNMAVLMAKDGEGAKKLVAFEVINAKTDREAEQAAKALSNSLLVKTAIFGEDPNWGRLASTIGASGIECCETKLVIKIGDVIVYDKGNYVFDKDCEKKAAKIMQSDEFKVACDIGIGSSCFTAYGCDLGYEYVKINADYRT